MKLCIKFESLLTIVSLGHGLLHYFCLWFVYILLYFFDSKHPQIKSMLT